MAITQAQRSMVERAKAAGGGELGVGLSDIACNYLIAQIVTDLGLQEEFSQLPSGATDFFAEPDPSRLTLSGHEPYELLGKLFDLAGDADTYFWSLASLLKSRLKYTKILEYQPIPNMDQVGPRALLQYGQMSSRALATFLLWRKWLFDIDNRAGQETGYLFEPIIASSIGGSPFSARKSPIRRHRDKTKGRQVDCVRGNLAYEFKIRVTIAASGQGRWQEELDFPVDCKESGYIPMLIVLDPTPNPKLEELMAAFAAEGGKAFVGDGAWEHLEDAAGEVMSHFLEKYVRLPIQEVLEAAPDSPPAITFEMTEENFTVTSEDESFEYKRSSDRSA